MRDTTKALVEHYAEQLDLKGDVLEIGAETLAQCSIGMFAPPRYEYHNLDITGSDIPKTIVADITDCKNEIPDNSFDVVISSDVFEHIDRPWRAAPEIARVLRPGGVAITHTLFAWRNHPVPIDYWRYSPECLEFLFADLECLEKGYDLSQRRVNQPGFWPNGMDSVPVDAFGGWREHWSVYIVNRKGPGPQVTQFKDSGHRLASHLRRDTQGTITNPRFTGEPDPAINVDVNQRITELETRIADLTSALERRIDHRLTRLADEIEDRAQQRHRKLDSRVVGMGQPLPLRAYRRLRRNRPT